MEEVEKDYDWIFGMEDQNRKVREKVQSWDLRKGTRWMIHKPNQKSIPCSSLLHRLSIFVRTIIVTGWLAFTLLPFDLFHITTPPSQLASINETAELFSPIAL